MDRVEGEAEKGTNCKVSQCLGKPAVEAHHVNSLSSDNFSIRQRREGLYYHNKHPSLVFVRKHFAVNLPAVFLFSSHHI